MQDEIVKKRGRIIPTRTPLSFEIRRSISQLVFALLIIIVIISIVFLLNNSESSQKGYLLKQYDVQRNLLIKESRDLISKIIKAQSTQTLESNPQIKEMVKPTTTIYLNTEGNSTAN